MVGTIVYGTDITSIDVVRSPLVSRIKGGVFRHVKHSDRITVDGSLSFDPDAKLAHNLRSVF